jgi:DNA-directed RNA polymerase specialized sigma24 family protein
LLRIPRATCRDQPTMQSHSFLLVQIGGGDAKQVLCLIRAWASRLKQTEHSELRVWLGRIVQSRCANILATLALLNPLHTAAIADDTAARMRADRR